MLPPLTVAGVAVVLAVVGLVGADTGVAVVAVVGVALTAVAGAALARTWDRAAGHRVAELETARAREEWRYEERIAEVESDLDESREIRGRLEKKLRARRAELARLRTEHAELLRRYAAAETDRARVLERNRQLQTGEAPKKLALPSGGSPLGPGHFLKAEKALRELGRNAATQQARATVDAARRREAAAPDEPQGRHTAGHSTARPAEAPAREHHLVPAAAAVLPYAQPTPAPGQTPRAVGGFDFFGTQKALPAGPASPAGEHTQAAEPAEVIDLTAHDETEQLDMTGLRAVPSRGAAN
jgi:hypothetical protein